MSSMDIDTKKETLEEALADIRKHMTALIEKGEDFPYVVVSVTLDPKTNSPRIIGVQNVQVSPDTKLKDMVKSFGTCIAVMNAFTYVIAEAIQPAVNEVLGDNVKDYVDLKDLMLAVYDACMKSLEQNK